MKNLVLSSATLVLLFLVSSSAAHATFGGCQNSPENPTLVLAGLAGGAYAFSQLKTRMRARRKQK